MGRDKDGGLRCAYPPNGGSARRVEPAQIAFQELAARVLRQALDEDDAAGTLEFLRRARAERQPRPDFVVVDPPRAGLGKEISGLLSQIGPRQITYVSCDPATLSRDLKSLLESGYHLTDLTMVDLFPQTFHLESVAILSR